MDGGSQYIFVLDAQIGKVASAFIACVDRFPGAFVNVCDEDVSPFYLVNLCVVAYFRMAIHTGGGFYHVLFFFGADAGYLSVVFYTDKQPSPVGIGESGECLGNFACVGYFKLEILLLVFPFGYEGMYISGVCNGFHGCKSRLKNVPNLFFLTIFGFKNKKKSVLLRLFQERVYFCPAIINQINP